MSPQPTGELTAEALEAAFTGTIEPVPLQLGYRMGLMLVALATVLLPLVYLGLIAATGYLVYLHATLNTGILTGSGVLWRFLAYLAPIIAGGLLVVFMIKPLFARPAREPDPITLDPARFALLFAFVDHIRRAVRAPSPREIRVDCNVNASASLRRGLLSLGRKDLVLTIGLPLISGMSARQLAGVLAHELGHFAQGSGMALTYLVRSVNEWLWRVVYTRDVWDERLERASEEWDLRVGVVLWLARLFIWVTRKILWALMMLGHAISTFLLRHMEFDADRYEARLAGSEAFAQTAQRMRVLSVGSRKAIAALYESWNDRRLVDDFASLVAASADALPRELLARIARLDQAPGKSVFDTHPPDQERIASARAEGAPGLFQLELPARAVLGADYEPLAREATLAFYETDQGLDVRLGQLVPLRKFVEEQNKKDEADQIAESYLHGIGSLRRPLPLPREPGFSEAALASVLSRARQARERAAEMAARLPKPAGDDAAGESAPDPDPALVRAVEESVAERLIGGLSLLSSAELGAVLPDAAALRDEAMRMYGVLVALADQQPRAQAVRDTLTGAYESLEQYQADERDLAAYEKVLEALTRLERATTALTGQLPELPYPFDHAAGAITLRRFATDDLPELGDVKQGAVPRAQSVLQRLFLLYQRALARTAVIAQRAERAAEEAEGSPGRVRTSYSSQRDR